MSFWRTMGWVAAGVGAVIAAPVTGGGSIAAVIGAAGTTTVAGLAVGATAGIAASALTDNSVDKARSDGRNAGRAEKNLEVQKLNDALHKQQSHFKQHKDYEDYLIALTAVGMACAACDGYIAKTEQRDIKEFVAGISSSKLPESVKMKIEQLTQTRVSLNTAYQLASPFIKDKANRQDFLDVIEATIHADGKITAKEENFLESWKLKIAA